ncbi:Lsr2 family protein [Rhodococcus sp. USK10]|uniref:Lsr2 family protein n=1 Tax=Rhodococcus sp. USK10 TaxID=2789739 RepID=UPI00215165AF|nr:Lsr2 family protein [Rhodococcus sp. USK10]
MVERIDGTPIKNEKEQTGPFSRDGVDYRIDLKAKNAKNFHSTLTLYIDHATRVGGRMHGRPCGGSQARKRDSRMADHGGSRAVHALAYPRSDRGIVQCSSLRPRPRGVDKTASGQLISSWPEAAAVPRSGVRRRFDQRLALVGSEAADTTGLGDRQFFEEFRSLH